jgi:transcriptional regulator with XRE-family HTH domain
MKNTTRKTKPVPRQRKEVDTSTYSGRFAVRLRALRDKTGMSADAFAEKHGFARTTFYSWESGIRTPSFDELPKIAQAFGISVRTLIPKE